MTPTELILMHLAIRSMGFNELMRATGLRRAVMASTLTELESNQRVWRGECSGRMRAWHLGADPLHERQYQRDYAIDREEIAPGHTVVRFGDRWRAGHGQRHPATPGRANALGNIYA